MREFFTTKVPQEIRDAVARATRAHQGPVRPSHADPQRRRARGAELAGRVGRPGLDAAAPPHLARGDAARLRAAAAGVQRLDDRPGHRAVRLAGDEGAVPAGDRQPRHLVVAGLLRARRRLRPRLAAHDRASATATSTSSTARRPGPRSASTATGSSRWSAPTRRPKKQAGISLLLIDMTSPGVDGAPDRADRRRPRGQRGVVRPTSACRSRTSSARRTGAGTTPSSCSATSGSASRRSAPPSGCSPQAKEWARRSATDAARRPAGRRPDRRARERAAGPRAHRAARGRPLRRRQAAPGVVGAQAQGHRAAAGGHRAVRRPRRPGLAGHRRRRRLRPAVVGPASRRRSTSTSARPRSTAAPTRCSARSSPARSWDSEERRMDFTLRRRAAGAARGRPRPGRQGVLRLREPPPRRSPRTPASARRCGPSSPRWACSGCRSPRQTAAWAPARSRSASSPRSSAGSSRPSRS